MGGSSGKITGINGNMLTVAFNNNVSKNEMGYVVLDNLRIKAEVIRIRGNYADLQIFEDPTGLKIGGEVLFTKKMLSVELGPGLMTQVYDGLQNPLVDLAKKFGFFLQRGEYLKPLPRNSEWDFSPYVKKGDSVRPGDTLGTVPEGIFTHRIMVPFAFKDSYTVDFICGPGLYTVDKTVASLRKEDGTLHEVTMVQEWPIKIPLGAFRERLRPSETLLTKIRILDTFFPIAKGGTYCIPGPFGSGKTVLQQLISRNADVDIVIIAACGERAGEVVETLREFPELTDPRTGRSLMERTVIICNTSSMPVAAREASVYTAVTIAEYYRQMGLHVLLLADSTSRWAQALREMSGRLEEIPGEEAFPAYLESVIAAFYERSGKVVLNDGSVGSVTIGGAVSPAGGNFEEPVTQATLKVVGAFHGLSSERSDARRYLAIDPLESWSRYSGIASEDDLKFTHELIRGSFEVSQMMKVIGEEGISIEDFILFLKGEYLDATYLQQDAYDEVDGATSEERQKYYLEH